MVVTLKKGRATAVVVPETGGAIATFYWDTDAGERHWLRRPSVPMPDRAGAMGCFPLVPFSNRVRNGRFEFAGRRVDLPVDAATSPHFEHGHGWRSAWRVVDSEPARLVMRYEHAADAWPWSYRAEQRVELDEHMLSCRIAMTNLSSDAMPMGLGLHPYFPITPRARLKAGVARYWVADAEVLPVRLADIEPAIDPNGGLALAHVDLDTVFTGWRRRARLEWPEWHASLDLLADGPLDFLVIYVPPGAGYCCVEPVSNMTDAFNFAARGREDTGLIVLAPGATVHATVRLMPSLTSSDLKGTVP